MNISNGRKRVIIAAVQPFIENGAYPAKAVVHQPFTITADIFTDGHDLIEASVLVRKQGQKKWNEIPLRLINNDHWECTLVPDQEGLYEFQVQARIDHFATWAEGLDKK